jgi:hypothetical protein
MGVRRLDRYSYIHWANKTTVDEKKLSNLFFRICAARFNESGHIIM